MEKQSITLETGPLRLEAAWASDTLRASDSLEDWCKARFSLSLDGRAVWGDAAAPAVWNLDLLLEHMARNWAAVLAQEPPPLGGLSDNPFAMRKHLARLEQTAAAPADFEALDALFDYLARHDLAQAFTDVNLPSLFLFRAGRVFIAYPEPQERTKYILDGDATLEALEALGAFIERRVRELANTGFHRAEYLCDLWERRNRASNRRRLALSTGLSEDALDALDADVGGDFWLQGPANDDEGPVLGGLPEDAPLVAVARMTAGGETTLDDLRTLRAAIADISARETPELDRLTAKARQALSDAKSTRQKDYSQGHALAGFFREEWGLSTAEPVNPEAIVTALGVAVRRLPLANPAIDAVGCWSRHYGPALFLNTTAEKHAPKRERATLAHELCHLILDRQRALPAAEVFGGRSPSYAERRANAFAAELLLPRSVALNQFKLHLQGRGARQRVGAAIDYLETRFEVSRSLAARQVLNAPSAKTMLSNEERETLEGMCSPAEDL